jgi:hypothetical protein
MMEAVSTSKTSVNFYESTWRNIPKDSYPHTRRRENMKSHQITFDLSPSCRARNESSDEIITVIDELERIWKETVVVNFKVLYRHLYGRNEQKYETPRSVWPAGN